MSFPLYNSPLVQKRTGCTPLRPWGPPSLSLLFGDCTTNTLTDLGCRKVGGATPIGKSVHRFGLPKAPRTA
ncbi:hypothetical protein HanXRQr2_Chr07g0292891 [Helianthus annuus]|uniref:Uncharacterized protein n=1 Tax=Helianthus annuus TaxID=4232 RepID=A0A9K3IKD4_HELAN|nr:hypothetical protein HanXRQr2_Chr07g0292891 [Helianthus annuus]KAJ0904555.1 hypothetical protein HanPSC8_Chr07g0283601 [Helianthus annuus]